MSSSEEVDPISGNTIPPNRRIVINGNPFDAKYLAEMIERGNWRNPLRTRTLVFDESLGREIWRLSGRTNSMPAHPGNRGTTLDRRLNLIVEGSNTPAAPAPAPGSSNNNNNNMSSIVNSNAYETMQLRHRDENRLADATPMPRRRRQLNRYDRMRRHQRESSELVQRLQRERRQRAAGLPVPQTASAAPAPRSLVDRLGLRSLWSRR